MFPFDDFHRYHRPAAWVASSNAMSDRSRAIDAALSWLSPDPKPSMEIPDGNWSEADMRTMQALGFKPQRH